MSSRASTFSLALLAEFVALGVTDVVVSPGSRSQALALAAAELERAGLVRLHVRIDERGAGFLALGLGVESGRPALVITTSGTAVANLHPAILEAHHTGVPLIALTADRPAELRGIRSNQTTMQPGIFAGAVRYECDAAAPSDDAADAAVRLAHRAADAAMGVDDRGEPIAHPGPGPVHLNLQLREPLSAPVTVDRAAVEARRAELAEWAGSPERGGLLGADAAGAGTMADASGESGATDASGEGAADASGGGSTADAGAGSPSIGSVPDETRVMPAATTTWPPAPTGPSEPGSAGVPARPSVTDRLAALASAGRTAEPAVTPTGRPIGVTAPDDAPASGALIAPGPRTLVVAGAGAGEGAEAFARAGGWPLAAEVSSGARFGPNLVVAYRELLREPGFGDEVQRVVVFGHPTLSREVPALVQRDDVETIVVAPSGIEWFNPGRRVRRFERAVRAEPHEPTAEERAWTGRWVRASRMLLDDASPSADAVRDGIDETGHVSDFAAQRAYLKAQLARVREPVSRRMLVEALWAATWPHDRLVFASSRLIRDADKVVPGRRIRVHANRGLAGIDGTVATTLGVAIASQQAPDAKPGVTRALVGDLALLHDAGSLLLGEGEARPRVQLIVGNDGGGSIFDALEVAGTAPADAFDRVQFTPQRVDLEALARAYGWSYSRAATRGELDEALGTAVTEPALLEVPLPR
ncbi:thiamine pyrophosphate-binding protein [Agromyces aerolatus]|uniref:thiamine pyrophosphate-binding protein n=1 Tax=Agromyces sp. LY-1074 TaxID=3074080 RepID=UPI002856784A|nr:MULTISPECIES: thiamine pyrophosphate-binding protein [unclassified Agromyces]MDR5701414.1 thiamine pyrophosphate-binding protein [Agromyces sp. LY-1074]MDR5706797.1 thiamine pyrophosphate-binding protein [Agromyces sp. LY-1358]